MRIAVNTRFLIKDKLEGIGWFTYESLRRIVAKYAEHEFLFIFDREPHPDFVFDVNVNPIVAYPPARHPFLWYLWFEHSVARILRRYKPDVFVSTDGFISLSSQTPSLSVIHDINFAHFPNDLPFLARKYYNRFFPLYAKHAARIATVSEYSKQDISSTYGILPSKIDVVYNGSNSIFTPLSVEEIAKTKAELTKGCDYFIFIGALNPRKNIVRLLSAYDKFRKNNARKIKLVIVGEAMFMTKEISQTYSEISHKEDVIFTGRLSPQRLKMVLGSAFALTYVPYFEGFGIPILEAMYAGVPVIAADKTSMPEVAGNAALFIDPYSVDSIVNAMHQIVESEELRSQLKNAAAIQKKKFSWDKTAEKLWTSIQKTIEIGSP